MASRSPVPKPAAALPPPVMPWLQRQLEALLQQQGHALLLEGPSGLGQFELGLALARAALCEARAAGVPPAPACGQCESCHAIDVHTHPDLLVLLPELLQLEWGWTTAEAEGAADSKRKPSKEIRIEAMRQMITFCQRTDARGRGKVVLIYPAENMNTVTANALLKTLEEPPGASRFVLVTDASHRLLPTIRSRCHSWHMLWPSADEVQQWLAPSGAGPEQLRTALQAAGGRPQDAWRLLRDGFDAQAWQHLPALLVRGDTTPLAQTSPTGAIAVLLQLCHDAMAMVAGAAPRYFEPAALAPVLPAWAQAGAANTAPATEAQQRALAQLSQWSGELLQAARTSEHPFSAELMLTALVDRARAALNFRV